VKQVFQNCEPFLAKRALKSQKVVILPKNFFFAKFEYHGYQNNPEIYADFKTVEKNVKKISNIKVIGKISVQN
jgi:hypothetical protein